MLSYPTTDAVSNRKIPWIFRASVRAVVSDGRGITVFVGKGEAAIGEAVKGSESDMSRPIGMKKCEC
jgi:hypothetical protein